MLLVLTTTDSKQIASKIGDKLLVDKLIACYSILPGMESSYWWKGKIAHEKEFQVIIKTKAENFEAVEKVIKSLHTYDLPEIIQIKIEKVGEDYLKWINAEIS